MFYYPSYLFNLCFLFMFIFIFMFIYFIYILFTYLFIFINIFIFIYVYFCFIIHLIIFHWQCVSDCWIASPQSPKSFSILTISLSFCFSGDLSNNHFQIKSAFFKNEDSLSLLNTDKVNHPFFGYVVWWPIFFLLSYFFSCNFENSC